MASTNETYAQRYYESALDYFDQGHYDKALQHIDSAIQNAPNNPDYYSTKGIFLHRMNDVFRAIEAYESALKIAPDHTFSHYNLGLIYMKEGKILQAIQQWEDVVKIKPDDIDSIFNIAVALSQLGKTKQAIPFYKKILELDPAHAKAHQNLGVIYRDEHELTLAKHHFEQLKSIDSTYTEVVETEIFRCEEQEFLDKLENEKNKAAKFIGNADNSDIAKALSALISEDYDQANKLAESVLEKSPDDKTALIVKGQALNGRWKTEDAIAVFQKVLEKHPDDIETLFMLGTTCLNASKDELALQYFERIFALDPSYPVVNENIECIRKRMTANNQENQ